MKYPDYEPAVGDRVWNDVVKIERVVERIDGGLVWFTTGKYLCISEIKKGVDFWPMYYDEKPTSFRLWIKKQEGHT